jgi:hypothetical protein
MTPSPIRVLLSALVLASSRRARRTFKTAISLETTSEDSANVSMGIRYDGDLDLVLAKGVTRQS